MPNATPGIEQRLAARILIADDTTSSRDLLRFILEEEGHVVAEADDGTEIVMIATVFAPHLMILDLHMPKLDGLAVVEALRKIPAFKKTPIVALTAAWSELVPELIVKAGFTTYLVKPIAPAQLRASVASLLLN